MADSTKCGNQKTPLVRYRDRTQEVFCPYGHVQRIVTGGDGGIANVHVVKVNAGGRHYHKGYDEVYYVLHGRGRITLNDEDHELCPGAVAIIPSGVPHELRAMSGQELEFVIFGTPAMTISDDRALPRKEVL